MKRLRAILIDAIKREVREVFFDGSLDEINKLIGCECMCSATVDIPRGNMLYVDDDGLFSRRKGAFTFPCKPGHRTIDGEKFQTLSGNGLIVGVDEEGYDRDTPLAVEEIRSKVIFVTTENLPDPKLEIVIPPEMATRIVIFDSTTYERIEQVIQYAAEHPYTMDDMLDVLNGQKKPPGDFPEHVVNLSFGVRVVYSHEEQNPGLCKHISISVDNTGKLPSPPLVQEIMKAFKIETPLDECNVGIEKWGGEDYAISVIEVPKKVKK